MGLWSFYLKHSINDLRVNGRRTLFALLCIAAGVGAIVSLQTLGVMIKDTLTGSLQETNRGDIRIFPSLDFFGDEEVDDPAVDAEEAQIESDGIIFRPSEEGYLFTPEGIDKLKEWFAENYDGEVRMTYQQSVTTFPTALAVSIPARDTDKNFVVPFIINGQEYPLYGDFRTVDDKSLSEVLKNSTDLVLAENLADDLEAEVGDTIRLNGVAQEFTVTGIVPTDTEGGFENLLLGILGYYYLDHSAIQYFDDETPQVASTIYVRLDNGDLEAVDALAQRLKRDYSYLGTSTTADIEERNSAISTAVEQLVIVMGLVAMLIGGIGIVNTMLVIVSRRQTEVAVLKTLGMNPESVTSLFFVQAILMGILGSLLGVLLGWGMAFVLQGVPEQFVAQSLTFRVAFEPVLNGFVIGVLVTAIFGFTPILAAGKIRPSEVLRPADTIVPRAGLLQSFAALMVIVFALSLLTEGLIGQLFDFKGDALIVTTINGVVIGLLLSIPIIIGGILDMYKARKGRSWALYGAIWAVVLFGLPILGGLFGYFVPTIIVVSITFILIASLYLLLLLLIWAVSGAPLNEFPVVGALSGWLTVVVFLAAVFWTVFIYVAVAVLGLEGTGLAAFLGLLLPVHIPAIIITLVIPAWVLGQVLQRFGFVDLKVALRAMAATKARGASTLLALAIGIFVLSTITMLVDRFLSELDKLLSEQTGGNVLIVPAQGDDETIVAVSDILDTQTGVKSYGVLRNFTAQFVSMEDVSAGETLDMGDLQNRLDEALQNNALFDEEGIQEQKDSLAFSLEDIDARELRNLPTVNFYQGRQLEAQDNEPDANGDYPIIITADTATIEAGFEVGDRITFAINGDLEDQITFKIVGMRDGRNGSVQGIVGDNYALLSAFENRDPEEVIIIADVEEDQVRDLRRKLNEVPTVFVLETKFLNDLITSVVNQFTSFPRLVAGLSLFTGGVVIANSVALSTLERRREIGIMKAVGLQRERVLLMLLLENGLMGLISGLIGVGMGVLLLLFIIVGLLGGDLGDAIPLQSAFLLMGLCLAIALGAAVLSVWGASGEKPLNVLRYE